MGEYGSEHSNDSEKSNSNSGNNSKSTISTSTDSGKSTPHDSKSEFKPNNKSNDSKDSAKSKNQSFKPKNEIKNEIKQFKPNNEYKPNKAPFKPENNYKPESKNFVPKSKNSPDIKQFKPNIKNEPQNKQYSKRGPNLYNDGKKKECGKCHQIKPHGKFQERMMRGKKTLRSICRVCRNENTQNYLLSNKFKVVKNMYKGKLEGKCQKCNTGVEKLPSLEFHHPNPELKTGKYIKLNRNWEKIKQQVENEKTTIICGNCHSREISHTYNQYKDIIKGKEFGPNATNKQIRTYVKSNVSDPKDHNRVYQLIKKKEAINQLYGGKCVACENISANENLPTLHFHHLNGIDPHKGSEVFNAIKNMEFTHMKNQLIEEKCVPICANCHQLERTSHFKNNYKDIIPPEYWNQVEKYYKKIDQNLKNFKFKGKER